MTTTAPASTANVVRIGPTRAPERERTIGDAVIEWAMTYLLQPDGPNAGHHWRFTDEQLRFVLNWYAINNAGRMAYRYGVLRRMKGWGKDPLGAVLCCAEFVGPCRFSGKYDRNGVPIAVPLYSSWVQTAAVAKEQTRNTMTLFPGMFSKKAIEEYSIDIGKEIIYAHKGRSQIQAVTSSPTTLEGARSTFILANETQHWGRGNSGHEMSEVLGRNTTKTGARVLSITNAHGLGDDSVAERDYNAYLEQGSEGDILYDSVEADADLGDTDSLRSALTAARGDSVWLDVERIMAEIRDPRTSESVARRFYLNQVRAKTEGWISLADWQAVERKEEVPPGTLIALGFDGSRFRDATALVGTVIATGYQWIIGIWERPEGIVSWEVNAQEVKDLVAEAFARWNVFRLYADPYWWEETIADWAAKYGDRVAVFPTNIGNARMARAVKSYETGIRSGELGHEPADVFSRHVSNAVRRVTGIKDEDGESLYTIAKVDKDSPHKIDAAMAAILSWEARNDAIASGALQEVAVGGFFA